MLRYSPVFSDSELVLTLRENGCYKLVRNSHGSLFWAMRNHKKNRTNDIEASAVANGGKGLSMSCVSTC